MTTEEMYADMKQFILALFAQQNIEFERMLDRDIAEKLDQKLTEKLAPISKQISSLSKHVSEAIDISNDSTDKQLARYEKRLKKLENVTI